MITVTLNLIFLLLLQLHTSTVMLKPKRHISPVPALNKGSKGTWAQGGAV